MSKTRVKCDVKRLSLNINQLGEKAVHHVSDIMRDEGHKIEELAREFAPIDEGNLEEAITYEEDRGGINRRLRVRVFVDEDYPGSNGAATVREYAMIMHERLYNPETGDGEMKLGPMSREKAASGALVGGKYMERAYKERAESLFSRVIRIIKKAL